MDNLERAIKNNDTSAVKNYIKNGYDVNKENSRGYTPIEFACGENGNINIVRALLNAGADIKHKNYESVRFAAINGHLNILQELIKAGADVNAKDKDGNSPLLSIYDTIGNKKINIVSALIKAGANIHTKDKYNKTVLHKACQDRDDEVIMKLIKLGADVNAKDIKGNTPLMFLSSFFDGSDEKFKMLAKALLKAGADINAQNNNGHTPLMHACDARETRIKILLDLGANMFIKDKQGHTVKYFARHERVTKLLENYENKMIMLALASTGVKRIGQRSDFKLNIDLIRQVKKHLY